MVTDLAGEALTEAAAAGETVSFTLSRTVSESAWAAVEALRSGGEAGLEKSWAAAASNTTMGGAGPAPDGAAPALWKALPGILAAQAGWPEREAALREGYESLPAQKRTPPSGDGEL